MQLWKSNLVRAALAALVAGLALPAALSAEVFAWRTDDGVYAYTDDPKRIPARYADQVVEVSDPSLEGYARYTQEDSAASRVVAERLQRRLDYLRQVNGAPAVDGHSAPQAAGERSISVATGNRQAPRLNIPVGAESEGPIVVEPVHSKRRGDATSRRTTVVKQGDRTLAVLKGRSRHIDVNHDIHDEDELLGE